MTKKIVIAEPDVSTTIEQIEIESDTEEGTYVEVYACAIDATGNIYNYLLLRTDFYPH